MCIIRNYIIFVITMIAFTFSHADDSPRNVVWVHGLDGDETSWEYYEQIFSNERLINGHRPAYNTDNGIDYGTNHLRSLINNQLGESAHSNRNIGIGHSMGGLVSRNLDRIFHTNNNFGGIITVTTPNYGAQIANSLLDGSIESAANHALDELAAGPVAQSMPAWIIGGINFGPQVGFTPHFISNLFNMKIDINGEIQDFAGTPTTNNDLRVGSSKINQINNYESDIPHIAMWANEQSSAHWRLFGSRISETLDPDINDQVFVDYMNQAQGIYEAFHDLHHS
ncbi:MAG: esterase/lipase family protein, partial [bacterium]